MLNRVFALIANAALLFGLVWAAACSSNRVATRPTRESVEKLLTHDLRKGDDATKVREVLKKHRLEWSWDQAQNAFVGIVRDVNREGPVSESISVVVAMDKNSKVTDIRVKSVFTGP
jgi:hypothetical protein